MARRILIVRLSALGDVALTLPLLTALREACPDAHLGWAVEPAAAPLLGLVPEPNRVHVWRRKGGGAGELRRIVREIRGERYDAALDPQGLTKSAVLPFLARIRTRIGHAPTPREGRELARFLNNRLVSPPHAAEYITERQAALGAGLGMELPPDLPVQLEADEASAERIRDWWRREGLDETETLVVGIGAGWPTKVWPAESVKNLLKACTPEGSRSVLLWGPGETDRIRGWRALFGTTAVPAPPTDIPEMVALLSMAGRYAGPDSAPLHIAALLGKPTFSWFGASDPARCAPRGPQHACVTPGPGWWPSWDRRVLSGPGLGDLDPERAAGPFREWWERT
jgi:ADP-heptose:LPS heptosyltransferase